MNSETHDAARNLETIGQLFYVECVDNVALVEGVRRVLLIGKSIFVYKYIYIYN